MNISRLLNFILGGALIAALVLLVIVQKPDPEVPETAAISDAKQAEATVLENIATRASVRAFKRDAIPNDLIQKLLKAGMAAPTALNAQPWHFIALSLSKINVLVPHLPQKRLSLYQT